MLIIDTNVLCRFILKDNPTLFKQAEAIILNNDLYLDSVIVAETLWVLTKFYKIPHLKVFEVLTAFISNDAVVCPDKPVLLHALTVFNETNLSFIDSWLVSLNRHHQLPVATFDEDLQKKLTG